MANKIKYIILGDKSLIIESYKGDFNVNELIEFKIKQGKDKDYNSSFNRIHDFREANFNFGIDEISKYINMINENNKLIGNRKSVMITNTPNQVVTSFGFDIQKRELPIQVKVCSTLETSFNFIELPKNEWEFVESLINSIKN